MGSFCGCPAGDQPAYLAAGICGSGIIEVVAEMYLAGVLAEATAVLTRMHLLRACIGRVRSGSYELATAAETTNGRPLDHHPERCAQHPTGQGRLLCRRQDCLMKRAGIDKVDKVILAGAFGSYIDTKHAHGAGLGAGL